MLCENLEKCPFYNDKMPIDSALGRLFKKNYCESDKTKCARYRVSSIIGKEFVSDQLYPNMDEKAENIIQANKK